MIEQTQKTINLEFWIIVAMTLLVLSFNWYNKNYEKIQNFVKDISYWAVVVIAVGVLVLAVVYNLRVYWKIWKSVKYLQD